VKLLLANGAQPGLEDEDGLTPLSRAEESGNTLIVGLLKLPYSL
jgi:ankyrin repeat protein